MKGVIAKQYGYDLELEVLRSARGYYLGTSTIETYSVSRESVEYWDTKAQAEQAMAKGHWTQREDI